MTTAEGYTGPRCEVCDGPCFSWKGSKWGYTCAGCLNDYLHTSAARADAKDRRARERLVYKTFHNNDSSGRVSGQRRNGGAPSFVPTTVSGAGPRS
ncbi:hypothetical protein [Mycolicibacterium sp. HK-90]|uniref:hypothetical protein n=1 Tax=Mycolicibacterium sp. HK-90 TaxID=3056937 RepID=UPI00265AB5FD|nr:hypothetical protein [Mycolicibacterium sp. HK-90]WKG01384.1 hypothetical protein QU592_19135 [Mycolicibacterium sp. HK-90]